VNMISLSRSMPQTSATLSGLRLRIQRKTIVSAQHTRIYLNTDQLAHASCGVV
jgi:hypothetical protein